MFDEKEAGIPVAFNENGYIIDGKPVWLASGEFQYFRLTREDWEPRLLQLKLAGFNTVSVYFAWNYHETEEGVWNFEGDRDAEEFLKIAARLGLYVVARPGPFICNEWTMGGIPAWLSAKEGIRVRTADPLYLSYCDKWWDRIAPLIAKYQLGREGTVILVQVENEYGHLGEYQEGDYIYHLRDGLKNHGITVPIINCDSFIQYNRIKPMKWEGINLCCNAGGDGLRVLQRARALQGEAPLFVTEFWIAAFDWWGRNGSAVYENRRAIYGGLEMVAGGAGGLTVFVFSGGSNFGYWHGQSICSDNNFMTTLYGPGAPILDDGLFSPKYDLFKTQYTALKAASKELAQAGMPQITGDLRSLCKAVRKAGDTTFTFFVNHSAEQMAIADAEKEQAAVDMSIPAGEVRWMIENLPLESGFFLKSTTGKLFAADPALVVHGPGGEGLSIVLSQGQEGIVGDNETFQVAGEDVSFETKGSELKLHAVPKKDGTPIVFHVKAGIRSLTVILLSSDEVSRWYQVDLPGMSPALVGGPDRIEKVQIRDGTAELLMYSSLERPLWKVDSEGFTPWNINWGAAQKEHCIFPGSLQWVRSFPEALPEYDDSSWYASDTTQPMSKFGTGNGRAWYRTTLEIESEGWQMIHTSGASDRWLFFVDGQYLTSRGMGTHFGKDCAIYLTKGRHTLAILIENLGMFNTGFEMEIPMGEPKGLYGPIWRNGIEIRGWKMREGLMAGEKNEYPPNAQLPGYAWESMTQEEGQESQKGPLLVKGTFPKPEGFEGAVRIKTNGGKGSIWINGFNIGRYWRLGPQDSVWIPAGKLKEENSLLLMEEEKLAPAKVEILFTPYGRRGTGSLKV